MKIPDRVSMWYCAICGRFDKFNFANKKYHYWENKKCKAEPKIVYYYRKVGVREE